MVTLLLFGVVWLGIRRDSPNPRRFLALVAVAYAILSTYIFGYGFGRVLTMGYRPLTEQDVPSGRTAVVILGSRGFTARDAQQGTYSVVNATDASRSVEAVRA